MSVVFQDETDAELLALAKATWPAQPHPMLGWLSDADLVAKLREPQGAAEVAELFKIREERIWLASEDGDPLNHGFELENWKDADRLLHENDFVYASGGKRASKSEWAAKRFVRAALTYSKGKLWAFQDNHITSVATQQQLVWKFLPPGIKRLNGRQDKSKVFAINYTPKNGFADSVLVLPNWTAIYFLTYNSDVKEYQGWQIGAPVGTAELKPGVENIGFWADENMTLSWLETCEMRCATNKAKGIWTFSTTEGITTTIKKVVGDAETTESRFAELLPDRVNVTGLPVGHMPYIQRGGRKDWAAIYFFSQCNVFGTNYAGVKARCAGKPSHYIEENAYGYARDVMNKAFPLFGAWNIIEPKNIPVKGTNYMFTDPAGARNWATLWVRVTPDGKHYIYRDWPDEVSYGEWAVPSDDTAQPDGDAGPAQKSLGLGTEQLKEMWVRLENQAGAQGGQPEEIFQRFIDPRAGRNPHADEHGGTCLIDQLALGDIPMVFTAASGVDAERGYSRVNDLLYWDNTKPLDMVTNGPRLFVSKAAAQVIWMFSNFTGRGGEKAGAKDFADLVRYMALAELEYYGDNTLRSSGGGSY